jgi:hypothetical protein
MCTQTVSYVSEAIMNLQAAQKELRGRTPKVTGLVLVVEVLVVVSVSYALVGIFA